MPRHRRRKVSSLTPIERKQWAQAMLQRVVSDNPTKVNEAVRLAKMAGLSAAVISDITGLTLWEIEDIVDVSTEDI